MKRKSNIKNKIEPKMTKVQLTEFIDHALLKQKRLQYLHREYENYQKLKSQGWILEYMDLPEPGTYNVWLKINNTDTYEVLNFDGHSWYSSSTEFWCSSGDTKIYAWKLI